VKRSWKLTRESRKEADSFSEAIALLSSKHAGPLSWSGQLGEVIVSLRPVHIRDVDIRRWARPLALAFVIVAAPAAARADQVTEWNQITLQIAAGPTLSRSLAMVHLAMFDAINALDPRYRPYLSVVSAPNGASAEAAGAAAAKGILARLFPAQQVVLDAALVSALAAIPNGPEKSAGLVFGDQVAAAFYADRLTDGMLAPNPPYLPIGGAGFYQPTPPGFASPVNTGAGSWRPFAMLTAAQFRGNGPLSLAHPQYRLDFDEVRLIGSVTSTLRTAEQSLIATWHIEQSFPAFNRIARSEAAAVGLNLLESARLFALLNMALADAVTSVFEAKYFFHYWRPVTAVRLADTDGNPATTAEPGWLPFIVTPPHPEYPSAHSVTQMAAVQVMEHVFGPQHRFTTTSANVPGVARSFESFRAYAVDGSLARLYGGIHFRTALEEGMRQGKQLGNWILETQLQPLR
jgi:hypothetical protein